MIGLEYALDVHGIQQKDLAEKLGINKQNVTLWIKGKQKIPKKYFAVLESTLNVSIEYLQKDLSELDKKYVSKKCLEKLIADTTFEYEESVWDENENSYVEKKNLYQNKGLLLEYRMVEAEENELKTINHIKRVLFDVDNDVDLDLYEERIHIFEKFTEILEGNKHTKLIEMILRAMELFFDKKQKSNAILNEYTMISAESLAGEDKLVKEIYSALCEYTTEDVKGGV